MLSIAGNSGAAGDMLKRMQWTAAAVDWADAVGPRLADAIRKAAPVGQGPNAGRLADATRYQRTTSVGLVRLEFHADGVPYVPFVLNPTRPHDIVPKAARALHWSPPGGGDFFAKRVHHPGTQGNNYPLRTATSMRGDLVDAFKAAIDKTMS
jgi:hypothetical protein